MPDTRIRTACRIATSIRCSRDKPVIFNFHGYRG
jgi:hypothetical protein